MYNFTSRSARINGYLCENGFRYKNVHEECKFELAEWWVIVCCCLLGLYMLLWLVYGCFFNWVARKLGAKGESNRYWISTLLERQELLEGTNEEILEKAMRGPTTRVQLFHERVVATTPSNDRRLLLFPVIPFGTYNLQGVFAKDFSLCSAACMMINAARRADFELDDQIRAKLDRKNKFVDHVPAEDEIAAYKAEAFDLAKTIYNAKGFTGRFYKMVTDVIKSRRDFDRFLEAKLESGDINLERDPKFRSQYPSFNEEDVPVVVE